MEFLSLHHTQQHSWRRLRFESVLMWGQITNYSISCQPHVNYLESSLSLSRPPCKMSGLTKSSKLLTVIIEKGEKKSVAELHLKRAFSKVIQESLETSPAKLSYSPVVSQPESRGEKKSEMRCETTRKLWCEKRFRKSRLIN